MKIAGEKFMVTGGISLIGSHVAEPPLEAGAKEVILFDNCSLGSTDMIAHILA